MQDTRINPLVLDWSWKYFYESMVFNTYKLIQKQMWSVYISKKKRKKERKGKVRISTNALLLNNKKNGRNCYNQLFQSSGYWTKVCSILQTFILKMQLNFGKSEELGDIFNLPQFHPLLCSNMMTWKTNNLHSAVKTSRLAATRGSKMALELPVKIHFQKIIIIWPVYWFPSLPARFTQDESLFPRGICQKQLQTH